jgi:F420-0:gamma-glutamyl ligase-like protein
VSFEIPKSEIRNQELATMLSSLRQSIKKMELEEVSKLYLQVTEDEKKYMSIYDVLNKFSDFFRNKISSEFLVKIKANIAYADSKPFYKF